MVFFLLLTCQHLKNQMFALAACSTWTGLSSKMFVSSWKIEAGTPPTCCLCGWVLKVLFRAFCGNHDTQGRKESIICWVVLAELCPHMIKSWGDFLGEKKQHGVFPVEPQMVGGCSAFRSYVASVIWVLRWETCFGEVWLQPGCCVVRKCWFSSRSPNTLKTYCRTLLHWSCCLSSLVQWGDSTFEMHLVFCMWCLHRSLWEVWPWWTHMKEKNSAVQPVLGSTDGRPCHLLVGFCWALLGWCFLICKLVLPKLFFSTQLSV